jgi:hypothetical protein
MKQSKALEQIPVVILSTSPSVVLLPPPAICRRWRLLRRHRLWAGDDADEVRILARRHPLASFHALEPALLAAAVLELLSVPLRELLLPLQCRSAPSHARKVWTAE